ncbi:MAG: fumarate hydratase C-terminal domain-containing protein [Armatimonadetes bacterium]|nr:fumarate hydratase C-terminal domain-containing protein [Armatimonadota bacterium]
MSANQEYFRLTVPCPREALSSLQAGQKVLLFGSIYTARDAAHQRLVRAIEQGEALPLELRDQLIYYCGPAPAPPGRPAGSCGPTTSARMDRFLEPLLAAGLAGTIGKGNRSVDARRALRRHGAVYFLAVGGAGALISQCVREVALVAYPELGPEAIYRMTVDAMPLLVAYDAHGGTVFSGEAPLPAEDEQ